jgi:hypothetical protein
MIYIANTMPGLRRGEHTYLVVITFEGHVFLIHCIESKQCPMHTQKRLTCDIN